VPPALAASASPERDRRSPCPAEALLDRHGSYLRLDEEACSRLGVRAAELTARKSFVTIPVGPTEVWWLEQRAEVTDVPLLCHLRRCGADPEQWILRLLPAADPTGRRSLVRRYAQRALEAVRGSNRDATVGALTYELSTQSGLAACIIVLIDEETGAPTFAGETVPRRQELAAMEECRRRGAPMVIWQAFNENRIVVHRSWARNVLRDPRLAPIRRFAAGYPNLDEWFVAVPLRVGHRRLGVIAGTLRDPQTLTPAMVGLWCDLADETALALGYDETIRAARTAGGVHERKRLTEVLHHSVAQDLFALQVLAARAEVDAVKGADAGLAGQIQELRLLAERVSSDLRGLLGEPPGDTPR
jgi:hypothetical protein